MRVWLRTSAQSIDVTHNGNALIVDIALRHGKRVQSVAKRHVGARQERRAARQTFADHTVSHRQRHRTRAGARTTVERELEAARSRCVHVAELGVGGAVRHVGAACHLDEPVGKAHDGGVATQRAIGRMAHAHHHALFGRQRARERDAQPHLGAYAVLHCVLAHFFHTQ